MDVKGSITEICKNFSPSICMYNKKICGKWYDPIILGYWVQQQEKSAIKSNEKYIAKKKQNEMNYRIRNIYIFVHFI